jgi:lysophospholipase L1-like esterase
MMKASSTPILLGALALASLSLLGCSSDTNPPASDTGGTAGTAITASGGTNGSGGASTSPAATGGISPSGGTLASGGTTASQGGILATGGVAAGGSSGGQPGTGGKATGGTASGGSATGGSATGGSDTGGSASGGRGTDAGAKGGSTPADASAGGKVATDGSAAGGTTSTGGVTPIGGGNGSSDGKTPIKVWMAGDSTMSGSGCDGGGWGTQFSTVFNTNVTVVNSSVAGRSIQTWLLEPNVSTTADASGECKLTGTTYNPRWTAMLDASTGMKAGDYLFVEFGINDGDAGCEKSRHVGKALFQTYLTTMAKAASDRGAQAIFLTSTSAIACTGSTAQANRGFGPETKASGAADNVPVIDVTTLSAALYTSAGLCPNSNDYSSTTSKVGIFFCNDHTHFSAEGALQIAQMVAKALKDQGIGLAAYLK